MPKRIVTKLYRGDYENRYTSKAWTAYARAYAAKWLGVIMANDMCATMNRPGFMRRFLDRMEGRVTPPVKQFPLTEVPPRIPYSRHIAVYPIPSDWPKSLFDPTEMRKLRESSAARDAGLQDPSTADLGKDVRNPLLGG